MIEICRSANDKRILFDPLESHTAAHFEDTPGLQKIISELFEDISVEEDLLELLALISDKTLTH